MSDFSKIIFLELTTATPNTRTINPSSTIFKSIQKKDSTTDINKIWATKKPNKNFDIKFKPLLQLFF